MGINRRELTRGYKEKLMLFNKQQDELLLYLATMLLEEGEGLYGTITRNGYEICNKEDPHMVTDEMVKKAMQRKNTETRDRCRGFSYTKNAGKIQFKIFLE